MSATGLDVFDKTLQTTHIWLDEIMAELGPNRQRAYHVLRAVLQTLRDRLTVDEAAHLGAQLPLLVKGLYFDSWHPAGNPSRIRNCDEFLQAIQEKMRDIGPVDPEDAARAVFGVLTRHVTRDEIDDVVRMLPQDLRRLWPEG